MREVLDAASEKIQGKFKDQPLAEAAIRSTLAVTYWRLGEYEAAIPHADKLRGLPRQPFIGELSYGDIIRVVTKGRRWLTKPERILAADLIAYLDYKKCCVKTRPGPMHQLEIS